MPGLRAIGRTEQRGVFHSRVNRVGIGERRLEVPDAREFPGMRRAVVPLMRAGNCGVIEFVADWLPRFAAVVGALNQLAEPARRLRRIDSVGVYGRAFEVIHFPAGKVRAGDVPLLALSICRQDERALARSDQHSYSAH